MYTHCAANLRRGPHTASTTATASASSHLHSSPTFTLLPSPIFSSAPPRSPRIQNSPFPTLVTDPNILRWLAAGAKAYAVTST